MSVQKKWELDVLFDIPQVNYPTLFYNEMMFELLHQIIPVQSDPEKTVRIAVVADTHCTIQHPEFNPFLIPAIKVRNPSVVLHCGDISILSVLDQLKAIAPTYAVTGNRDYAIRPRLPDVLHIHVHGVGILLTHGHGPLFHYLIDKYKYMRYGFVFERYQQFLLSLDDKSRILIFGHTHTTYNQWVDNRLFFNPGAAGKPNFPDPYPSFGLIEIQPDQQITAEIIYLK